MANAALHAAACALLVAHVLLVTVLLFCGGGPPPLALQLTYVLGALAGVWNHGTTSAAARWTDRIAMVVGLGVDLYYVATRLAREGDRAAVVCLLALAVLAYASAKCASSSAASASALASASASAVRDDDDNNYDNDDDGDSDGDAATTTTPPTRDITTHLLAHALVLTAHAWLLRALGTA
jgi:glucose dehydrogenase